MTADLLAHHFVEIGGAVLHAGRRIARIFRGTVIDVRRRGFRLLVDAIGLSAGLFGSLVEGFCALLERLEVGVRHFFSPEGLFRCETRPGRKSCMAWALTRKCLHSAPV